MPVLSTYQLCTTTTSTTTSTSGPSIDTAKWCGQTEQSGQSCTHSMSPTVMRTPVVSQQSWNICSGNQTYPKPADDVLQDLQQLGWHSPWPVHHGRPLQNQSQSLAEVPTNSCKNKLLQIQFLSTDYSNLEFSASVCRWGSLLGIFQGGD